MELLINLSESYHTLIGIFAQRNPLKNWPMSFFYSMAVILISYSFSIFGFPTYVSQLVIFVVLLTGALIEPSDDKTNAMVKATIFATLPYINLKLDGFIQDFFLSNIQIESIETELIVSHIISLILIILLTRRVVARAPARRNRPVRRRGGRALLLRPLLCGHPGPRRAARPRSHFCFFYIMGKDE